jgi:uncharacterized membrane protein YoaK (UPF0700 family)
MNATAWSMRSAIWRSAACSRRNMTGNVVLLGFGIAGSGGLPVLAPVVSLGAFLVGAVAGALLLKADVFAPLALAAVLALVTWLVYVPAAVRLGSNAH